MPPNAGWMTRALTAESPRIPRLEVPRSSPLGRTRRSAHTAFNGSRDGNGELALTVTVEGRTSPDSW